MPIGARAIAITTGVIAVAAAAVAAVAVSELGLLESVAQTSSEPASEPSDPVGSAKSSKAATAGRKTVTTQFGGWTVTCEGAADQSGSVCSAAFRVFDKKSNATILTWLVGRNKNGELLTEFFVPTEVLIPPGLVMSLEDGPGYKAEFVACGRSGCKAALPLDAALATELANATKASLTLTASNGKATRFSMGIDGIGAALAELGN